MRSRVEEAECGNRLDLQGRDGCDRVSMLCPFPGTSVDSSYVDENNEDMDICGIGNRELFAYGSGTDVTTFR